MIRLLAVACGLLCGAGFVLSGLYDPALLQALLMPQIQWDYALGLGLICAVVTAGIVVIPAGKRKTPLLGGDFEPVLDGTSRKQIVGAVLFGLGWGLSGYFPLSALVSAGMLSPVAPIFLTSVLAGMILSDVITNRAAPKGTRRRSRG